MLRFFVKNFNKGLITRLESQSIPRGAASDSLNWHFLGDRIELRRGQQLLGTEVAGSGRVNFVKVARKYDGTEKLFWGYGTKALHYDESSLLNTEIGSDIFSTNEDISATIYQSLAGSFVYLGSPNNSTLKIPVANPGSAVDLLETTYRGYLKATQGRMFLFNRKDKFGGSDKTGLQLSTVDRDSLADYDFTSAEDVGTGNGSTTTFTGTLAFKAANSKKTCHFVRIAAPTTALKTITAVTQATAPTVTTSATHGLAVGDVVVFQDIVGMTQLNKRIGVVATVPSSTTFTFDIDTTSFTAYSSGGSVGKSELFTDDRSGALSGSLGGTGTINYATGVFSVTFATAPVNTGEVVSDYYSEDSTNQGIIDFNQGAGSSIADSLYFPQADAGFFMGVGSIGTTHFCLHTIKTYALRLVSTNDITNLIYREKVGIPYFRAYVPTGDGIYYLDATDPKNPQVRLLALSSASTEVLPKTRSDQLNLSSYEFDTAVMFEWNEYICLACRTEDSTVNNRLFMYHRIWKTWEVHSFMISDMDSLGGALIGGDSGSNNIFKLFTGLTDQDSVIPNFFITGADDVDYEGVKDVRRAKIAGMIGDDQEFDVSYSVDNEPFVFVRTISGRGSYVDRSQRKLVGSLTLGEIIGGGATVGEGIFASPFALDFPVGTKRFSRIRFRFEATSVGHLSISEYGVVDGREKGLRLPMKYVAS